MRRQIRYTMRENGRCGVGPTLFVNDPLDGVGLTDSFQEALMKNSTLNNGIKATGLSMGIRFHADSHARFLKMQRDQ